MTHLGHRSRTTTSSIRKTVGLVACVLLAFSGAAPAGATNDSPTGDPRTRCLELVGEVVRVDRGRAVVDSASIVLASPGVPEYCDVLGTIDPEITFQLRLPTTEWNRRYFQTGCGGFCGSVPIGSCGDALSRGYAVAAEDSGHRGSSGDGAWALDNRPAEVDFGYRSPHVTAVAGKAITERFYGQAPSYSYFQGCSTGGRQGLSEAQRYPDDFDGIVAGAPALYQNYLAPLSQGYLETVNRGPDGKVILPISKVPVVASAVLAACDGSDGRLDGVVGNPDTCDVDPVVSRCPDGIDAPSCLTPAQVEVARAFYAPPVDDRGRELYPAGLVRGSESGWPGFSIGTDVSLSGGGNFAQEVLRYLAFPRDPGGSYSLFDFDPTRDAPRLKAMAKVYNADDTDLSKFEASGGKLLVYHGWADPLITPGGTVNYVQDAMARAGGREQTTDFLRLFLLPGVYHCAGGPGQDGVDWLTEIEQWVEEGQAPDSVVATKQAADGAVLSTRVVPEYVPAAATRQRR